MSEKAEKLKAALTELTLHEQVEIADFIYSNIPIPPTLYEEGSPEFDELLDRRLDDLRSGRVKGVPAEEFMEQLRTKYAR